MELNLFPVVAGENEEQGLGLMGYVSQEFAV